MAVLEQYDTRRTSRLASLGGTTQDGDTTREALAERQEGGYNALEHGRGTLAEQPWFAGWAILDSTTSSHELNTSRPPREASKSRHYPATAK